MKGKDKVIAKLNEALRGELTAINQYFAHAEMCHNWGYHRLGNYIKKQSIGEMKHAEELPERILFLDGVPSMQPRAEVISSAFTGDVADPSRLYITKTRRTRRSFVQNYLRGSSCSSFFVMIGRVR